MKNAAKEKILIVDDETAIADLMEVYLKNEGYDVLKFYDGKSTTTKRISIWRCWM